MKKRLQKNSNAVLFGTFCFNIIYIINNYFVMIKEIINLNKKFL